MFPITISGDYGHAHLELVIVIEILSGSRSKVSVPGESDGSGLLVNNGGFSEFVRNAGNRSSNSVGSGECSPSGVVFTCNSDDDQVAGSEVVRVSLEDVLVDDALARVSKGGAREVIGVVLIVRALDLDSDVRWVDGTCGLGNVNSHGTSNSLSGDSGHNWGFVTDADVENVGVGVCTAASTNSFNSESEVL